MYKYFSTVSLSLYICMIFSEKLYYFIKENYKKIEFKVKNKY